MAFVLAIVNQLNKSKCKEVKVCSCLKVIRDVEGEEILDAQQIRPNPLASQNDL